MQNPKIVTYTPGSKSIIGIYSSWCNSN